MAEPTPGTFRCHVLDGLSGAPGETFRPGDGRAFQMRRAPVADRHVLRLPPDAAASRASFQGFDVSQPINAAKGHETLMTSLPRASLRLGPDEWLLIGSLAAPGTTSAGILVDITHRNVAIDVRGHHVRDVLNTGTPLDLDESSFTVGCASRTLFAKAEIVLVRCEDSDGLTTFRIECWRSFARYLVSYLAESAALLGFDAT